MTQLIVARSIMNSLKNGELAYTHTRMHARTHTHAHTHTHTHTHTYNIAVYMCLRGEVRNYAEIIFSIILMPAFCKQIIREN